MSMVLSNQAIEVIRDCLVMSLAEQTNIVELFKSFDLVSQTKPDGTVEVVITNPPQITVFEDVAGPPVLLKKGE